jgi:hypothetical protein
VTEFWAREYSSSNDAYVVVTYETNTAPSAPTVTSPTASAITTQDPTFAFSHNDSDGDALLKYDAQLSSTSDFSVITESVSNLTAGITGNNVSVAKSSVFTSTLTRGATWYVRFRTYSSTGVLTASGWSSARAFVINSLATCTITNPGGADRLAQMTYSPGAGWASPRMIVEWSRTDADVSQSQYSYRVVITTATTSGGTYSAFYDSGTVVSTATSLTVPATFVEQDFYKITVTVSDSLETGTPSTELRTRARWGVSLHRFNTGVTPTAISLTSINSTVDATKNAIFIEYGTNSTTSTPSTFYASIGSAAPLQYLFFRVYLTTWGASPATATLSDINFSYTSVVLIPDNWTRSDTSSGVMLADPASYVYGSKSLRIAANGSKYASQAVSVLPNTNYVLSGRIKSLGNSGAYFALEDVLGTPLVQTTAITATQDFTRDYLTVWNSGSRTTVYVVCRATGSSGTYAWFDAMKMEASSVVTPWSPGFVGAAIQVDAGGLQVDANAGGIMRLRGSTGGTRDLVELGTTGLKFGGDVQMASAGAKRLSFGDTSLTAGGTAFPASPATNELYFRTDLGQEFYYDGTRWLSTALYSHLIEQAASTTTSISATSTWNQRVMRPLLRGGSDIYMVQLECMFFVNSGGTALGASHKWVGTFHKADSANSLTTLITININSGASSTWRVDLQSINALLGSFYELGIDWTKTGTPGSLVNHLMMTYRIVAT